VTSFDASEQSTNIVLRWTTSDEKYLKAFEVEKSTDGIAFNNIGSVAPDASHHYRFTDADETPGKRLYRLRVTEASGDYSYTNIIRADKRQSAMLLIYPSTVCSGLLTIVSSYGTRYTVTSIDGHSITSGSLSEGINKVMLTAPGTYIVSVFSPTAPLGTAQITVL
jgi:hypothetical protein